MDREASTNRDRGGAWTAKRAALACAVFPCAFLFSLAGWLLSGVGHPDLRAALHLSGGTDGAPLLALAASAAVGAWFVVTKTGLRGELASSDPAARAVAIALGLMTIYLARVELDELHRVVSRTTDFGILLRASQAIATGHDPYLATDGGYFYPPLLALCLRPLVFLGPAWASVAWFATKLWLLAMAVFAVLQMLPVARFSAGARPWVVLAVTAASARFWIADLRYGNTNVVLLALVVGALHSALAERPRLAGGLLAVATLIKVVPAALLVWFVGRRQWRAVGWFALGCGAIAGMSALPWLGGVEVWQSYWTHGVVAKLGEDLSQPDNQSLLGWIQRTLGADSALARPVWLVLSGLLAALLHDAAQRSRHRSGPAAAMAAAMAPAFVLSVSPGSWVVHYALAMLPLSMVLVLGHGPQSSRWMRVVFWVVTAAFTLSGWSRPTVRWSIEQSWFLGGLLLLQGSLYLAVRAERRPVGATGVGATGVQASGVQPSGR